MTLEGKTSTVQFTVSSISNDWGRAFKLSSYNVTASPSWFSNSKYYWLAFANLANASTACEDNFNSKLPYCRLQSMSSRFLQQWLASLARRWQRVKLALKPYKGLRKYYEHTNKNKLRFAITIIILQSNKRRLLVGVSSSPYRIALYPSGQFTELQNVCFATTLSAGFDVHRLSTCISVAA